MNKKISVIRNLPAPNKDKRVTALYKRITHYIDSARYNVQRTVDSEMVKAYWLIGRDIIEEEQKGKKRAEYGSFLLNNLAAFLTDKYGKGFSVSTLRDVRQFYLAYHDYNPIHHALRGESEKQLNPNLGWIHYRALMRVQQKAVRDIFMN